MSNQPGARVFVTQGTSRLNLAKAHRLGELVELLPENTHISMSTQPVLRELRARLREFNDEDYLLPLGDPVVIGLATVIAAEANNGRLKILKWDQQMRDYYVVTVDVYDRMKKEPA